MPGQPPKPTKLLKLQGTARKCRIASRAGEPIPVAGPIAAPDWLLPEAADEWRRVQVAYGDLGILTPLDRGMLATYCQMWARFVEAESAPDYVPLPASLISTMATVANKLGLDPSGRVRLRVPDDKPDAGNPWDDLDGLKVIQGGKKTT